MEPVVIIMTVPDAMLLSESVLPMKSGSSSRARSPVNSMMNGALAEPLPLTETLLVVPMFGRPARLALRPAASAL